jgi:hypothetical protein
MNPRQPMFTLLTHFGMFELLLVPNGPQSAVAFLAQLPALTHFAGYSSSIIDGELSELAQDILAACKSLRVFAFRPLHTPGGMKYLPSVDDIRFVYIDVQYPDFGDGWIGQTRGGTDYWARADAFVEKKAAR